MSEPARDPAYSPAQPSPELRLMGHELRSALNIIIGFSEFISLEQHGPIGDEAYREYAELIRTSGLNMLELVNRMLERAASEDAAAPTAKDA